GVNQMRGCGAAAAVLGTDVTAPPMPRSIPTGDLRAQTLRRETRLDVAAHFRARAATARRGERDGGERCSERPLLVPLPRFFPGPLDHLRWRSMRRAILAGSAVRRASEECSSARVWRTSRARPCRP